MNKTKNSLREKQELLASLTKDEKAEKPVSFSYFITVFKNDVWVDSEIELNGLPLSGVFPIFRLCCAKLRCCREKQARDQEQEDALLSKL